MSEKKDGGPVFPNFEHSHGPYTQDRTYDEGMSLRDWFAGMAFNGMVASETPDWTLTDYEEAASLAYSMADAMLKEREK